MITLGIFSEIYINLDDLRRDSILKKRQKINMNQRNSQLFQLYALRPIVALIFTGALISAVSGMYGMTRYFAPNNQQTTK